MTLVYRGMDRAALDAAYDNTLAVADSAQLLADFDARSEGLRRARATALDLRYGPAPRNRIDYFAGAPGAPLLVFIHGGYWQMRAKETFSFVAAGPLAHGIHVALIGYTLAPAATLAGIVAETRAAIAWLAARAGDFGGDAARIYVSGWSAGGHLTTMCAGEPAVRGGLAISGIYDLEPIRLCYLNAKLGLNADDVAQLSPLRQLAGAPAPLTLAYGGDELPELRRQSVDYAAARAAAAVPGRCVELGGCNHFTILEQLADPAGALTGLLLELIAG
jgi:acetyl esterase/lipase